MSRGTCDNVMDYSTEFCLKKTLSLIVAKSQFQQNVARSNTM